MEWTTDEKNLIIACLRDFVNTQTSDLKRAENEPDWAEKWAWVLKITKRNQEMAKAIIEKLEKGN